MVQLPCTINIYGHSGIWYQHIYMVLYILLKKNYLMQYHNENFGINVLFVRFQFMSILNFAMCVIPNSNPYLHSLSLSICLYQLRFSIFMC
jgi:hypothetical protein